MQPSSLRSNRQRPLESVLESSHREVTQGTHPKRVAKSPSTASVSPRTSKIDADWELPEDEAFEDVTDSVEVKSGIRRSCPEFENQTLRPGLVPVFAQSPLVFEVGAEPYSSRTPRTSRWRAESFLMISMGMVLGIWLTLGMQSLRGPVDTGVRNTANTAATALPRQTSSPRTTEASKARASLPNVETAVTTESATGTRVAPALVVEHPRAQTAPSRRKRVAYRPKAVASDNPY